MPSAATACEQWRFVPQTWLCLLHGDYLTLQWYMPCFGGVFFASSAGNFSFLPRVSVLETFSWQNSLSVPKHGRGPGTCLPQDFPSICISASQGFVPWGSLTLISAQTNSSLPPPRTARPNAETNQVWKPWADISELSKSTPNYESCCLCRFLQWNLTAVCTNRPLQCSPAVETQYLLKWVHGSLEFGHGWSSSW